MAVDAYALTTLVNLKAYLGETTTTYDTILESCIDRASAMVESACDRKFATREFCEWHCIGDGKIKLRNWPLLVVRAVGYGVRDALSVSLSSSGYIAGTVSVQSGAVGGTAGIVVRRVATDGTTTNSSLAFSNYDTLSELATQANLLGGITAAALVDGPSAYLYPNAGESIVGTTVYLSTPSVLDARFSVDEFTGILTLRLGGGNDWGHEPEERAMVIYTAGYSTIPYDIEQATIETAADLYRVRRYDTGTVTGDFRDIPSDIARQETLRQRLAQWMEVR